MSFTNFLIKTLKKIPIDLGQESFSEKTKGKKIALSLVKNAKNKTALDIGCRKGIQTKWLKKKGYKVTSIDVEKNYKECLIIDCNKKLPFKDNSFDLIWCSEVIEHLDNPSFSITEFRRILKINGEMILTTPNSYFIIQNILSFFGLTPKRVQRKDHKFFFNIKNIKRLFPNAKIYGYFFYILIKRRIVKNIGLLSPTFIIHEKKEKITK